MARSRLWLDGIRYKFPGIDSKLRWWMRNKLENDATVHQLRTMATDRAKMLNLYGPTFQWHLEYFIRDFIESHIVPQMWIGLAYSREPLVPSSNQLWTEKLWPSIRKDYEDRQIFHADVCSLYLATNNLLIETRDSPGVHSPLVPEVYLITLSDLMGTNPWPLTVVGKLPIPLQQLWQQRFDGPVYIENVEETLWPAEYVWLMMLERWEREMADRSLEKMLVLVNHDSTARSSLVLNYQEVSKVRIVVLPEPEIIEPRTHNSREVLSRYSFRRPNVARIVKKHFDVENLSTLVAPHIIDYEDLTESFHRSIEYLRMFVHPSVNGRNYVMLLRNALDLLEHVWDRICGSGHVLEWRYRKAKMHRLLREEDDQKRHRRWMLAKSYVKRNRSQ